MSNPTTADALAFTEGRAPDHMGRTIEDYLKFDADEWERCHNHVQWAFPSDQASAYNPYAPVIDISEYSNKLTAEGFRNIDSLLVNFMASLGINYYPEHGLFYPDTDSPRWNSWVTPMNHNYLRLTRVLNLLSYLNPEAANHLLFTLLHYVAPSPNVNKETVIFWSKAGVGYL